MKKKEHFCRLIQIAMLLVFTMTLRSEQEPMMAYICWLCAGISLATGVIILRDTSWSMGKRNRIVSYLGSFVLCAIFIMMGIRIM